MLRQWILLLLVVGATASQEGVNPIRRIVTLLQKMQAKTEAERDAADEAFKKQDCFCKNNLEQMQKEIADGQANVDSLSAAGEKAAGDRDRLDAELKQHKGDRAEAKEGMAKAQEMRKKESADYAAANQDNTANLDAMKGAVEVLSGKGGAMLLQSPEHRDDVARLRKSVLVNQNLSSYEKESMMQFMSGQGTGSIGEVVGILKNMADNTSADIDSANKAESDAQKTFEELSAASGKEIAAASSAIEKKQTRRGEQAIAAVQAAADAQASQTALNDTVAREGALDKDCADQAAAHNTLQSERAEELTAISEVIGILNNDEATEMFKKTLPSPKAPGQAFLQIPNERAKALSQLTPSTRSSYLLLQNMLKAGAVSKDKIIKMIDDMGKTLSSDQDADDSKLDECNSNIRSTQGSLADDNDSFNALNAKMEKTAGSIAKLGQDIAAANGSIAEVQAAMKDAVAARKDAAATWAQEKANLGIAKQLLEKAENRLNKFYNPGAYTPPPERQLTEEERIAQSMGEVLPTEAPKMIGNTGIAVNFLQAGSRSTYKKQDMGGITKLMQMLLKDVDTQLSDGQHADDVSKKDTENFLADSAESLKANGEVVNGKEEEKASLEEALNTVKEERHGASTDVKAGAQALKELHENCDFLIKNFDLRKESRNNEREGLKRAKAILAGADFSFIQESADPAVEVNYQKIEPFGKEDTAHELQKHAAKTQDTLVDAVENAEVAEIKRTVFRALTRLRAATIKEFDTIARLETQAIDAYNDAHHYRAENPLAHLHEDEAPVPTDKLKSFH